MVEKSSQCKGGQYVSAKKNPAAPTILRQQWFAEVSLHQRFSPAPLHA